MLMVTKDESGSPQKIIISGVIDESTALDELFGSIEKSIHVYCKDISRINSTGIQTWVGYFSRYRNGGGTVRFFEISPVLVTTTNYISNFFYLDEIASLCVPFQCADCSRSITKTFTPDEVRKFAQDFPKVNCPTCKGEAFFDEIFEEYFAFLK